MSSFASPPCEAFADQDSQTVVLVGSVSQLDSWVPAQGKRLSYVSGTETGLWQVTVSLPASTSVEFKFVILNADGTVASWE